MTTTTEMRFQSGHTVEICRNGDDVRVNVTDDASAACLDMSRAEAGRLADALARASFVSFLGGGAW